MEWHISDPRSALPLDNLSQAKQNRSIALLLRNVDRFCPLKRQIYLTGFEYIYIGERLYFRDRARQSVYSIWALQLMGLIDNSKINLNKCFHAKNATHTVGVRRVGRRTTGEEVFKLDVIRNTFIGD